MAGDGSLLLKPVGSCDPAAVFGTANLKKRPAEDTDSGTAAKRMKTTWANQFNTRQGTSTQWAPKFNLEFM